MIVGAEPETQIVAQRLWVSYRGQPLNPLSVIYISHLGWRTSPKFPLVGTSTVEVGRSDLTDQEKCRAHGGIVRWHFWALESDPVLSCYQSRILPSSVPGNWGEVQYA